MQTMQQVIKAQGMCVMATIAGTVPHCSLMAYITDDACRNIFMITPRTTKKWTNMCVNPSVSLLIDTRRQDSAVSHEKVQALTINGVGEEITTPDEVETLRKRFVASHPHLAAFAGQPDTAVFAVRIEAMQLMNGATDASYETLA